MILMIASIVPLPRRMVPRIGKLCAARRTELSGGWHVDMRLIQGRDLLIPPLYTYKVISYWCGVQYEHVFMTTEPISIHALHASLLINQQPQFLCPISVTITNRESRSVWLFRRSIEALLFTYQHGQPFHPSTANISHILPHGLDRMSISQIVLTPYQGVTGLVAFIEHLLSDTISSSLHELITNWEPPAYPYTLHSALVKDLPDVVSDFVGRSMDWVNEDPDSLMEEWLYREHNTLPYVARTVYEHLYLHDIDPITAVCINTPSYVTLTEVLGTGNDVNTITSMWGAAVAAANSSNGEYRSLYEVLDVTGDYSSSLVYAFVEYLSELRAGDVTIQVTHRDMSFNDAQQFTKGCYDRIKPTRPLPHRPTYYPEEELRRWIGATLVSLFIDPTTVSYPYDHVVMTKTWLDEVFIKASTNRGAVDYYYLDLTTFRLVTPSLVNRADIVRVS